MADGEIRQLYADREKTKPIYPRVSSKAVILESGQTLEALETDIKKIKAVKVTLKTSDWSDSAPYTATVTVDGMTEDWEPGMPVFDVDTYVSGGNSMEVADLQARLEAFSCLSFITSAENSLTFGCLSEKPAKWLYVCVPGMG